MITLGLGGLHNGDCGAWNKGLEPWPPPKQQQSFTTK